MYGMGLTDEVKGTGVWSAFELSRDESEDNADEKQEKKTER